VPHVTLTPRQWIERLRAAIHHVEDALVTGKETLLGDELAELGRLRDDLRTRLSKLEQRPWPSARWHAVDPSYDRPLAVLLARVEQRHEPSS
jgi:hypothetical protein